MNMTLGYLSNIPDGWNLVHLGRLTSEVRTLNSNCTETNALQFKMGNIISKSTGDSKYHPETLEGYTIVAPGDVVVNGLNLNYDLKSLRVGQVRENGVITSAYIIVRPEKINADYFKYLLKGFDSIKTFHGMGKGIRLTLGYEELRRMYIPVPSPSEQSRIATFLDGRCEKIDEAIAKHKALIEKLDEYRKAVITKAVTKGVRGEREMKESGVDWIGKIPIEWNISKVSRHYNSILGKMVQPQPLAESDSYKPYICAADLGGDTLDVSDLKEMWISPKEESAYTLLKGDLLVVEGGDVGSSDILKEDLPNVYFQNSVHRVRGKHGYSVYFLRYYLIFAKSMGYIEQVCNRATIMHFTKEKFGKMPFIVMTSDEQSEIVAYLDKKCAAFDSAKERHAQLIAKLEEYKKSLIYNAVTGKIEC